MPIACSSAPDHVPAILKLSWLPMAGPKPGIICPILRNCDSHSQPQPYVQSQRQSRDMLFAWAALRFSKSPAKYVRLMQGHLGEKSANPGPRVPRHLITPPMPGVVPDYAGRLEIPENIECWKGSIFSIYSKEVADWENSGYGALLQTPAVRLSASDSCRKAPCFRLLR